MKVVVYNLSGAILKDGIQWKLALVVYPDAGSTDAETLVGWYDFKYAKEQSKDSPVSAINGKDMFRGVYLAETKVRPLHKQSSYCS